MTYSFRECCLIWNASTGEAITIYPDSRWSGGLPIPEDEHHGKRLGISAKEHRLHHELAHHLVSEARGTKEPVVYRDAHHIPQDPRQSEIEEWMVTSIQYYERGKTYDAHYDPGAITDLKSEGVDVDLLSLKLSNKFNLRGWNK